MKISVIGWYGHNNTGDEAYKIAIPKIFPDDKISFAEVIDERDDADLILLGGGDIVSDFFIREIKKVNKKKIAASVTIHKGSALSHLNLFEEINVRDIQSLAVAKNYVEENKLHYLPDFTLSLVPNKSNGKRLIKKYFDNENHTLLNKLIIVNINSYLSHIKPSSERKGFTCFLKLAQDIADLTDKTEASFLFIPFGTKPPDDDRVTNSFINACCQKQNKNIVIYDRINVIDTLDIISAADIVISSRLHCTIFSTIASVPFIDITHHDKNLGFIKTLNKIEWSIPFWNFEYQKCVNLINKFLFEDNKDNIEDLNNFTSKSRMQLLNFSERIKRDCLLVH